MDTIMSGVFDKVFFSRKRKTECYANIIAFAESVSKQNPHALIDVVRLIGRKTQADYFVHHVINVNGSQLPKFKSLFALYNELYPVTPDMKSFFTLKRRLPITKEIHLNRDLILPWPHDRSKLIGCISDIGKDRNKGEWRQDANHSIELWLPLGISWVHCGNHSITSGIVQGSGIITTDCVYDISDIYDYVYCDGRNFFKKNDDTIIGPVNHTEFAAIFEIGRMMRDKGVSF